MWPHEDRLNGVYPTMLVQKPESPVVSGADPDHAIVI